VGEAEPDPFFPPNWLTARTGEAGGGHELVWLDLGCAEAREVAAQPEAAGLQVTAVHRCVHELCQGLKERWLTVLRRSVENHRLWRRLAAERELLAAAHGPCHGLGAQQHALAVSIGAALQAAAGSRLSGCSGMQRTREPAACRSPRVVTAWWPCVCQHGAHPAGLIYYPQ
jgi:hypothetical protein